jgi:hypothetical protein
MMERNTLINNNNHTKGDRRHHPAGGGTRSKSKFDQPTWSASSHLFLPADAPTRITTTSWTLLAERTRRRKYKFKHKNHI